MLFIPIQYTGIFITGLLFWQQPRSNGLMYVNIADMATKIEINIKEETLNWILSIPH
jgi:hypothetical protein